jgi:hypothetical protein
MMGKVVIDSQMVGIYLPNVIMREALKLAEEKGLDSVKLQKSLEDADTQEDFMNIIIENFGDELIVLF